MKNKVKMILSNWREIPAGTQIRPTDMQWIWNQGPWTRIGDMDAGPIGQFYRPISTKHPINGAALGKHWMVIRRKTKRAKK